MLCPYKGAALLTLEKIKGTVTSYYVNQIYKNEQYNLYWFINSKGYAHVLKPCKVLLNGRFLHYAIEDNDLSTAFKNSNFVRIYKRIVGDLKYSDKLKSWMEQNK